MAEEAGERGGVSWELRREDVEWEVRGRLDGWDRMETNVKSPVASLCLVCSSVRNRVRVTMSRLIFSWATGGISPLVPLTAVDMMPSKVCQKT